MGKPEHIKGKCLCGAVHYEADGPFSDVGTCHCDQCAQWTGHVFASVTVQKKNLRLTGEEHIGWYRSSEKAQRGFCKTCGSSLFWELVGAAKTDILAGTLEHPTGLKTTRHIYVDDKSDYYDICDDVPQFPQYSKAPKA